MTVNVDDVLRATWEAKNEAPNTTVQNVFWFKADVLIDPTDLAVFQDIRDELLVQFGAIQLDFTTKYILNSIRVVNQTQKTFVGDSKPAFAGTAVDSDTNAAQLAVEVLARGNQLGHTGRKYLGPVADATLDNGDLSAAAATRFALMAGHYEEQFTGANLNVMTPGTAKLGPGGVVLSFRPFAEGRFVVVQTARTQRRRIPGVGLG